METKLNWKNLTELRGQLVKQGFSDLTPLVIGFMLGNGQRRKSRIRFGDFMSFVWSVSEIKSPIRSLCIETTDGKVLFRYEGKIQTEDRVPYSGDDRFFQRWSSMSDEEKNTILRLMVAQTEAYAQQPPL